MKSVLLIGLGRFGRHMAAKLQELHHEVLAVDKNEERVNEALDLVTHAQIGDSTSEAFIASLGVRNFDLCVVAIGDDFQSSLETTAQLKEQGARFVLSRAARDVHAKFLLRNGADDVVYPERETASWAAVRYSSDHIFDYIQLTPDHAIYETAVPPAWVGKTIGQLGCASGTISTSWPPSGERSSFPFQAATTASGRGRRCWFWARTGMYRSSCTFDATGRSRLLAALPFSRRDGKGRFAFPVGSGIMDASRKKRAEAKAWRRSWWWMTKRRLRIWWRSA